ncbi:MAG: NADH-quinone oxidoreductase subunit E [Bacteroidales bacterium]|jgi:formate hydrogenlyase subunit 3/multisubunit Na+/H+ antiporter MnhD subunit|nr:NADH-quinone oxidoreductase subunit E [Bacteroidales bacterium]
MFYLIVILIITGVVLLAAGKRSSAILTALSLAAGVTASSWLALSVLFNKAIPAEINEILTNAGIVCDSLSAVLILIISFTIVSGFIYSIGYLPPYTRNKPELWTKAHYAALFWLYMSMIAVVLFRSGFAFLVAWEIMTISSFILVIYEYDKKGTIQAGINYLVQMHIGMLFILFAFIISSEGSVGVSFDNLQYYFSRHSNWPVFLLFFIGFGLKAGFIFLHTWLPEAHPAAPSHVSGIMSGVMIKLGIYGILRVSISLQGDMYVIGTSLMVFSALTGLFGVMMAILQHDIKRLLAYHSIENIGIIGIGIGLGIFGTATGNTLISVTGYTGAILHTLNHSLFKSLLFFSAGSVTSRLHTRNVEQMGGIMKYMPFTAMAFLIGSVAIAGLPPFNGFISEYLLYFSLFSGIGELEFYPLLIFSLTMVSLVLIGGLAVFCFAKVFSLIFLGQPRNELIESPAEAGRPMLIAKMLPVVPIVIIGVVPVFIVAPLASLTSGIFNQAHLFDTTTLMNPLSYISVGVIVMASVITLLIVLKRINEKRRLPVTGPTWGCGYTAVNSRQQYTAASFTQEYATLVRPVIKNGASHVSFREDEIFPGKRDFHTSSADIIRSKIILRPANLIINLLRRAAVIQTGRLQHYVLYAMLFLVLVFLLTLLEII